MLQIRLADLNIHIDNRYGFLTQMCADYLFDGAPDISVSINDNEILHEALTESDEPGYLESLAAYRKIAEKLPLYDAFLMHASVIDIDGTGVAFLAKSGVGKTTHTLNWQRLLGDRFTVVNGDKPIVRVFGDEIYAYGTPWSGKENFDTNTRTRLKKICFIERAAENSCTRVEKDLLIPLLTQIYMPKNPDSKLKLFTLLDKFVRNTEFYRICCTADPVSAEIAYNEVFS